MNNQIKIQYERGYKLNKKRIKEHLRKKLDDFIKHIDDNNIKKIIRENTIITGGAIVSLLTGLDINDYDLYFRTKESCLKVANYFVDKFNKVNSTFATVLEEKDRIKIFIQSSGVAKEDDCEIDEYGLIDLNEYQEKSKYRPVYLSSNAITLSDKIQMVVRFYGEPEEIHKNFDFVHCTCYYTSWDDNIVFPAEALESIITKNLFYIGSKYPLCSIIRTRKFISRGWKINAGQFVKMAVQLNELDLEDPAVLEDQLVGVDSAYFHMVIEAIKQENENNENFKLDSHYLIKVIDEIF